MTLSSPAISAMPLTSTIRLIWSTLYSAYRWAAAAAASTPIQSYDHKPPEYSSLRFGFLQGSRGLPYGGYLTLPPRLLRSTITLTKSLPMFSVLGTQAEILDCLRSDNFCSHTMLFCNTPSPSDILVEVYRIPTPGVPILPLRRLFDAWFSKNRQLVVRPASHSVSINDYRRPLLKVHAPQGITLVEVARILEETGFRGKLDLTRDKAVNISVMGRSRSASLLAMAHSLDNNDSTTCQLPPYQRSEDGMPPPYTP